MSISNFSNGDKPLRLLNDFNDLSPERWEELCVLADEIYRSPERYSEALRGRVMATLFYEPSTRTQLSFQTAMLRLGGKVIGFSDPGSSSVSKGETLRDTVKIVSAYSDIIVIRNPVEGAAYAASLYSRVPVVNAGDGGHLHPTQTMADMFTIRHKLGRTTGLTVGLCGDLLNGRTVHSLLNAFSRSSGNRFYLISTASLALPSYIARALTDAGNEVYTVSTLEECISELDILYMTRIQRERFDSPEEYAAQAGIYILDRAKLAKAKPELLILHPLPKVDEIAYDVDDDPRAGYFEQAEFGMYVRMALILTMCEGSKRLPVNSGKYPLPEGIFCHNPRCISNHEKYLPRMTVNNGKIDICAYCDKRLNP